MLVLLYRNTKSLLSVDNIIRLAILLLRDQAFNTLLNILVVFTNGSHGHNNGIIIVLDLCDGNDMAQLHEEAMSLRLDGDNFSEREYTVRPCGRIGIAQFLHILLLKEALQELKTDNPVICCLISSEGGMSNAWRHGENLINLFGVEDLVDTNEC